MDEFTMNLQLFADGENIEDNANLDNAGEIETQNVVDDGDTQPEVDVDPEQQSIDKDNPANHAFAEMRRKLKEQDGVIKQQSELDKTYADLAKKLGYEGVNNAKEFAEAVKRQETLNKYKETNDPEFLIEAIVDRLAPKLQPAQQDIVVDNGLNKELEEFNKTFKQNLKSIDEITTLSNHEEVLEYMMNGIPLHKAYAAANPDKIAAANKQAIINQVKGHNHVKANSNGGTVEKINVTAAEVAQWKQWFPEKPDEQCRKEIAANKKLLEE
jgi:hypothetical protein